MTEYSRNNPYGNGFEPHFDDNWYNRLVATHGIRVSIDRTTICPNFIAHVDSMQHDPNCTLCENGMIHFGTIQCWAVFQQDQLTKAFFREGVFDPGQALMTFPSITEDQREHIIVAYFDRITLLDQEERFQQLLNKSDGDMDYLRYKALRVLHCMDRRGNVYSEGSHFKINTDGNLEWLAGAARPRYNTEEGIGESFTISYTFRPVYRVLDMLHEGRYSQKYAGAGKTTTRFPQTVVIKKDYYITKKDVNGTPFKPVIQDLEFLYETTDEPGDY